MSLFTSRAGFPLRENDDKTLINLRKEIYEAHTAPPPFQRGGRDDCMDAGGRVTQDAVTEGALRLTLKPLPQPQTNRRNLLTTQCMLHRI